VTIGAFFQTEFVMVKSMLRPLLIGSALALAGCASSIPPVEVTRFHLGTPIAIGTVAIETPIMDSLEQQTYATAVSTEMARLGYPTAAMSSAAYIANVNIRRDTREALAARNGSGVSVGIGGGTGGYRGGGVGLGLGFTFGGKKRDTVITELSVQIKRRIGGDVVWEGRAQTEAKENAPAAQPGLAAQKLASALFQDFPGVSGRTIQVK